MTKNQLLAESLRILARGYSTESGRDTLLAAARVVELASNENAIFDPDWRVTKTSAVRPAMCGDQHGYEITRNGFVEWFADKAEAERAASRT